MNTILLALVIVGLMIVLYEISQIKESMSKLLKTTLSSRDKIGMLLADMSKLNEWEQKFIVDMGNLIDNNKKLSTKQMLTIDKIYREVNID